MRWVVRHRWGDRQRLHPPTACLSQPTSSLLHAARRKAGLLVGAAVDQVVLVGPGLERPWQQPGRRLARHAGSMLRVCLVLAWGPHEDGVHVCVVLYKEAEPWRTSAADLASWCMFGACVLYDPMPHPLLPTAGGVLPYAGSPWGVPVLHACSTPAGGRVTTRSLGRGAPVAPRARQF
jgi:hypothetical protein